MMSTSTVFQKPISKTSQLTNDSGFINSDIVATNYSDLTFPVAEGDLCIYESVLYAANQAISTSETWTSSHWTATSIDELNSNALSAISGKYTKPSGGIPSTDLASGVTDSLALADSAYQKPSTGIPASDIASGVIPDVSGKLDAPSTAGTNGQVLVSDGNGGQVWGNAVDGDAVRYLASKTLHVGDNLIAEITPSLGAGWSGSLANGFTHASGSTEELTFNVTTTTGSAYIVSFDCAELTNTKFMVALGDEPQVDPYNGRTHVDVGFVSAGGQLRFIPKSSFVGTINNLKFRKVQETGSEIEQTLSNVNHGSDTTNLTGFWNVAIGSELTQKKNQNGSRNIAIGYSAQAELKSGTRNVAIGTFSMPYVKEGDRNVAIGSDTLYSSNAPATNKAYDNVAIGKGTMRDGASVKQNVAIGSDAMASSDNTDCEGNVAIGYQASYYAKKNNTSIGKSANYYTKGNGNTAIGVSAGNTSFVTGDNNTCIGFYAGFNVPGASSSNIKTVSNSIAIGYQAKATKSYQMVLGSSGITEVVMCGNKKINFNNDGTVTWETLT